MKYYSVDGKTQIGPVDEEEFQSLVEQGIIVSETLIWEQGMSDWEPYGGIGAASPPAVSDESIADVEAGYVADDAETSCSQCGNSFHPEDMIRFRDSWVCAKCKPLFVQKLKEGVPVVGEMRYAGFWIRFLAKMVDSFVTTAILLCLLVPMIYMETIDLKDIAGIGYSLSYALFMAFNFGIPIAYNTFFLGKFGATPGKMACHLKVVTETGDKIGYGRAFCRYLAEFISSMILLIGYIMAAFDAQKRSLHDHICATRVVKK